MGACQSTKNNSQKINRDFNANNNLNSKKKSKTANTEGCSESPGDEDREEDYKMGSTDDVIERSKARNNLPKKAASDKLKGKNIFENLNSDGAVMADGIERAYDNRYITDKNDIYGNRPPVPKLGDEVGAFDKSRMHYIPDKNPAKIEFSEVRAPDEFHMDDPSQQKLNDSSKMNRG